MNGFIDLIYPASCILCKMPLTAIEKIARLCFVCQAQLARNRPPFCRKCSRPPENPQHHFCLTCQNLPLNFDHAWGVFLFNEPMQRLLHLYKYGRKTGLRHFFADQMLAFIREYHLNLNENDLIVPIPLHPSRLRNRGFNQSLLLADLLSQELNLPVSAKNLQRVKPTPNQARLSQKERWTNIEDAFKINHSNEFREKRILLIDDLYTTGATVSEAAKTLRAAGAKTVTILTIAIAVSEKHPAKCK